MYTERQRLFPGEVRSIRNVLEEAILAVECRGENAIKRQDVDGAVHAVSSRPRSPVEPLPPSERLARYGELVRQGVSDNDTLRNELGYPETPEGRKSFREWKARHRDMIEVEEENE
ncbi:MAG: hypothetical protein R3F60_21525 [bacterium]